MNDRLSKTASNRRPGLTAPAMLLFFFLLCSGNALAADDAPATETPAEPIHITSDRLITDNDGRNAEFSGNVKVVQGATTITADRLKLFYKSGSGTEGQAGADNFEKIEAVGSVRIVMDNAVAESPKAIYTAKNQKLVLSGPGTKVTRGEDVAEGNVITFYRGSGRIEMLGDKQSPVKMIIRSEQRGLN
jgi:lipopolysaccharide export system protein LptA